MTDQPKALKKPPTLTTEELREMIMKGFEEEERLLASLPKKFDPKKGECVIEVPYDLDE